MSLRFTQTDKWKDDWYLSLSNDNRIVWQYLLDNCSIAGRFKKELFLLNSLCSTKYSAEDLKSIFEEKLIDMGDYFFIPNYLKHQYPSGLTSNKPLIVSVRKELEKYKLLKETIKHLGNDFLIITEPLDNGSKTIKVRDKVMVTGNGKGNGIKKEWDEKVNTIFAFYCRTLKKTITYELTPFRKEKIIARLKDAPLPGIEWAPDRFTQCLIAICQMSLSEYHQGANENGKRYVDLVKNCFKSRERVSEWIQDAQELDKLPKIKNHLCKEGLINEIQTNV